MSITILGGIAKSHPLKTPSSDITRPTSVLLRRKIFDSKQDWQDKVFIDACAGSGAMGIEAWSRGASNVVLIESQRKAYQVLESNVNYLTKKFPSEIRDRPIKTVCSTFQKYWKTSQWQAAGTSVTIFIDPPYENHELYLRLISLIGSSAELQAELWIESDKHKGPNWESLKLEDFSYKESKLVKQGSHFLGVFTKEVL